MAYFLKTTHYKKGDYIQIYFSFRDPETRKPRNRCWKTLGYIQDLQKEGIADPVSYYREEVRRLNEERRRQMELAKNPLSRKISSLGAARNLGYFPAEAVWNQMDLNSLFDDLTRTKMRFSAARCIHDLVMAKVTSLQSRDGSFLDNLGLLWKNTDWSREQVEACLDLLGREADAVIGALSRKEDSEKEKDARPKTVYLGWTSYYMDSAGPADSKNDGMEDSREMVLDLGIALDEHLIPSSLFLSARPLQDAPFSPEAFQAGRLSDLQNAHIVRVADKLLNDPQEIYRALQNQDGYIYSRYMETLSPEETAWVFDAKDSPSRLPDPEQPVTLVKSDLVQTPYAFAAENGDKKEFVSQERRTVIYIPAVAAARKKEIRTRKEQAREALASAAGSGLPGVSTRYLMRDPYTGVLQLNHAAVRHDLQCAGYQVIVTTDTDRPAMDSVMTYAELWRMKEILLAHKVSLEESLSARKSAERIKGSFVICFLALLLERKARVELLEDQFSAQEFDEFVSSFQLVEKLPGRSINLAESGRVLSFLEKKTGLPLSDYELDENQVEAILNLKISA